VGERLGEHLIAYLDTQIAAWLGKGQTASLTKEAKRMVEKADILISPMVVLELEYLYEVGRIKRPALDVVLKLEHELRLRVCDLNLQTIARSAIGEKWTRDPFDRMIVAHAKANGFATLILADEQVAAHYPRTVW
jgi:PIN domain nuclease of toxin-antitoxin system